MVPPTSPFKIHILSFPDKLIVKPEIEDEVLKVLNKNYEIDYKTYDNSFTGINNNIYLDFISKPLNISYSSMNYYNEI